MGNDGCDLCECSLRSEESRWRLLAVLAIGVLGGIAASACTPAPQPVRYTSNIDWNPPFVYHLDYESYTLPNRLTVVLAPDATTRVVTVDVRYMAGELDEARGKGGLADLTQHASFDLRRTGEPSIRQQLDAAALSYSSRVGFESTHYSATGLSPQLELLLRAEAQRMRSSCQDFSEESLTRNKILTREEIAQDALAHAEGRSFQAAIWGPTHRLATPRDTREVAALTRSDVCDFLGASYNPNRAALIIGGAFEIARARALVEQYFGSISSRAGVPPPASSAPLVRREIGRLPFEMKRPTAVLLYPLAPQSTRRRTLQELALRMLDDGLRKASQFGHQSYFVRATGTAIVGSGNHSVALVYYTAEEGAHLNAVAAKLREDVARQARLPDLAAGPLKRERRQQALQLLFAHDSPAQRGELLADAVQFGGAPYQGQDLDAILKASHEEISRISAETFHLRHARSFRTEPTARAVGAVSPTHDASASAPVPTAESRSRYAMESPLPLSLGAPQPAAPSPFIEHTLPNGLRMILVPKPRASTVHAQLIFPVGTASDPAGRAGAAKLTAMTLSYPFLRDPYDHNSMVVANEAGNELVTQVETTATSFVLRGNSASTRVLLWLLHTFVDRADFNEFELSSEQELARDEIELAARQSTDETEAATRDARKRLNRAMLSRLAGAAHPYASDLRGDLTRLSVEDLEAFRAEHYVAKGALLVVVGDFPAYEIAKEIAQLWGPWPTKPRIARALPPAFKPAPGPSYLALEVPEADVTLRAAFAARSSASADHATRQIAAQLLSDRIAARRANTMAIYDVDVRYLDTPAGSLVEVIGSAAPERADEAVRAMIEALRLDRLAGEQFALEVERARRKALVPALLRGSSEELAAGIVLALRRGLPPQHDVAPELAGVTVEAVAALLRDDFAAARMVVSAAGPGAAAAMKAVGLAPVEVR